MPSNDPEKKRLYDRRRYAKSRDRRLAEQRARYDRNPVEARKNKRLSYLKTQLKSFGLTLLDYYTAKSLGCEICRQGLTTAHEARGSSNIHLDHDHATGKFRGFLCNECNTTLGKMKDNPATLRRAANYLEAAC